MTAAGNGIGLASALAMAREGAEVWATDINQDALAQLARQAQAEGLAAAHARALNVLDTQAVQACAQRSARWTRCSTAPATSTPATSSNARNPIGTSPWT